MAQDPTQGAQALTCNKCQAEFFVMFPIVRVMNSPEVSVICLTHEEPERCPKCGQLYACAVADITNGIKLTWVEVPDAQRSQLRGGGIVAPTARQTMEVNRTEANVVVRPTIPGKVQ